ncbi:hypothetical protein phytr_8600 [Candidatus Phycorickettsia trachydisci]|uniref:Ribonuclease HII n=1 Tax=Candidatus Phycorickettsia trachydisci TaxID=2115978 RepID=A0A2P1P940_9RICK|nr:ribonuclease HII [Candidatus Phycorickettsia trachydisci]AVP87792.1 hypothetical protein phytr_8600 [Candidatus Phycorickettsia trachydisci]
MKKIIVGSDEVGRGPLAGPIVAGAVTYKNTLIPDYVFDGRDSKLLSTAQREKLSNKIWDQYLCAIGIVSAEEIDLLGISLANRLAIIRAINNLKIYFDVALVDGNLKFDDTRFFSIIQGDKSHELICAASIIAKVWRDNLMQMLHNEFPCYNWSKNKGYGTKEHLDAIKKLGTSPYHRKTFKIAQC